MCSRSSQELPVTFPVFLPILPAPILAFRCGWSAAVTHLLSFLRQLISLFMRSFQHAIFATELLACV